MNDELKELERRLERATSRRPAPGEELDREAFELRESWLALGQLLEGAQPPDGPVAGPPRFRSRRRLGIALRVGAMLAASLLLALAWWGGLGSTERAQPPAPPSPVGLPSAVAQSRPGGSEELAWDDSWEQQVQATRQEVWRVQREWTARGDATSGVSSLLDEIEQELEKNTI